MHVHDSDVGTVRNKAAKKEKKEIVSIVDMDLHVKNWVITKPQNTKHSAVQVRTTDQWISWLPKSVLVSGRLAWSTIWDLQHGVSSTHDSPVDQLSSKIRPCVWSMCLVDDLGAALCLVDDLGDATVKLGKDRVQGLGIVLLVFLHEAIPGVIEREYLVIIQDS
jgi:hypothetical protein